MNRTLRTAPPRLLVLSAGFGEGHNAAARALRAAWERRHGANTAWVKDVFEDANPVFNQLARRGYIALINHMPRVWSGLYAAIDRHADSFRALAAGMTAEKRLLSKWLVEFKPDVVCSTYPVYAFCIEDAARSARVCVPHFNVVTDSISINALWWKAGASGWFLPNEDSAEIVRRAGVDPERVFVDGFPVAPEYSDYEEDPQGIQPADLASGARPRVLVVIHSGRGAVDAAYKLLHETDWEVTCTVGNDEKLRERLQSVAMRRSHPTRIFGWTSEMPFLLRSHHVVVGKAGGASTQEAIAAKCPMVVTQIVPGQEEGNYELLRRHGIGGFAPDADAVVQRLKAAFLGGGALLASWRNAIQSLSTPNAADRIATRMLSLSVNN